MKRPALSPPGMDVIGPSSPVVQSLDWLEEFFGGDPKPDLDSEAASGCGLLIANHLLRLLQACGLLNVSGSHSPAVALLRPLEDALDCFGAVVLVPGAAEAWQDGELRPSDAARKWTPLFEGEVSARGRTLAEYRKDARGAFNKYSHCSYELCLWDLYLQPKPHPETREVGATLELNRDGLVIDRNAHAIDAHITAHLLEFIHLVTEAYSVEYQRDGERSRRLAGLRSAVVEIMERHDRHGCQDVRTPPELRALRGD